jgi:hypothetical protein
MKTAPFSHNHPEIMQEYFAAVLDCRALSTHNHPEIARDEL